MGQAIFVRHNNSNLTDLRKADGYYDNFLSCSNKGCHDLDGATIFDLNQRRFLRFYFSIFSLVLVSIEKIHKKTQDSV